MKYFIFSIYALFFFNFFMGCQPNDDLPTVAEMPVSSCVDYEIVTVDFEPAPFGDLVQTIPYHIEKESINDAFISVKIAMHQIPWVIWFHSDSVKFKEDYPVHFLVDDYTGNIGWQVSQNQSLFEMHLWDTIQAHNILYDFEQLKVELEIECYNN